MTVGREKFWPLPRPTVDGPRNLNLQGVIDAEWKAYRKQVSVWDRAGRNGLRESIVASVQAYGESHHQWALRGVARQQAVADAWWKSLQDGDCDVLESVLVAAFSDNPAPVTVAQAEGPTAVLLLHLPPLSVVPERKAHVTPSGQLTTKAWTKTDLNQAYSQLLAIHLLATLREAWAVAPSLQTLRIIGLGGPGNPTALVFDVTCARHTPRTELDDPDGSTIEAWLAGCDVGLRRTGRTKEVTTWPTTAEPQELTSWLARPQPPAGGTPWTIPIPDPGDPEPVYTRASAPTSPASTASLVPAPKGVSRHCATPPTHWAPPPNGRSSDSPRVRWGLALLASFFVAGLGSLLNRRRVGAYIFAGWLGGFILLSATTGALAGLAGVFWIGCWLWGLVDAVAGGRRHPASRARHMA